MMFDPVVDGLIVAPAGLGLLWAVKYCMDLASVKLEGHGNLLKMADSLGIFELRSLLTSRCPVLFLFCSVSGVLWLLLKRTSPSL